MLNCKKNIPDTIIIPLKFKIMSFWCEITAHKLSKGVFFSFHRNHTKRFVSRNQQTPQSIQPVIEINHEVDFSGTIVD